MAPPLLRRDSCAIKTVIVVEIDNKDNVSSNERGKR